MARRLQGRQSKARWKLRIRRPRDRNLTAGKCRESHGPKTHLGSLKSKSKLRRSAEIREARPPQRLGTVARDVTNSFGRGTASAVPSGANKRKGFCPSGRCGDQRSL